MTVLSFDDEYDSQNLRFYTYQAQTGDFVVTLRPLFIPEQSKVEDRIFVWYYHVQIENQGKVPCQLMHRFWKITDALANVSVVNGKGVGGDQPVLNPGEIYEYTSAVPLSTPSGFMTGHYNMESQDGRDFNIDIPMFSLDSPYTNLSVH